MIANIKIKAMPLNQLARQRVKPAMKNKYRRLLLRSRYKESKANKS